ncbi:MULTISPECIES: preprotein translocase subunit SecG [unclassified Bartonella]|uniref:preprotein translocase subunit SecG n=1 Tax=unclassified Bartonella TaxID=2645622 RepID=UPI0015F80A1A|nr:MULTISPECIES: preprotein translocase subunit SecG [unclassified Bartonella]UXN04574.1 preprotein translocase subunit SecG [Bartonella sp. HY406]UXN07616.1 preprotein translocase subunit SecG [Bartonella sp. HY761]
MQTVVIVIHLLIVIALVGVILIQRSEGGGLGIGGGSGFMTARGTKNALTRFTAILAGCFFLTSIILTVLQSVSNHTPTSILDNVPPASSAPTPVAPTNNGVPTGIDAPATVAPLNTPSSSSEVPTN